MRSFSRLFLGLAWSLALQTLTGCGHDHATSYASDAGAADLDGQRATADAAQNDGPVLPDGDGATSTDAGSSTDSGVAQLLDGAFDADVPGIDSGLLTAVQGAPPPSQGMPGIFVLVGCPRAGAVEVVVYSVTYDGMKTAFGPYVGDYTAAGTQVSIVVTAQSTRLVDIEYDRTNSISIAPFEYAATVAIDPSLLTDHQNFVARELNPGQPTVNDVGVWFSQTLAACPGR